MFTLDELKQIQSNVTDEKLLKKIECYIKLLELQEQFRKESTEVQNQLKELDKD